MLIQPMRAWRSCVVPAIILLGFVGAGDRVQAQGEPARTGTLVIKVPRGLLPSDDYWIYVNGELVNRPPYGAFTSLVRDFLHSGPGMGSTTDEFWDASGQAAASDGGRFTYLRPGLREQIFENQPAIQKAPGKYVIELMTRAVNKPFPFTIARIESQVTAARIVEIEFGIPTGTDELLIAAPRGTPVLSPEATLQRIHTDLNRTIEQFDALPIVAVLNEMMLTLPVPPSSRPKLFARLPTAMGGGRDLDARQVSLLIKRLWFDHEFVSIAGDFRLQGAASPIPEQAAVIEMRISRHNARIDKFRQIVTSLEQAKR